MSIEVKVNPRAFQDAVEDGVQPVIRHFIYDLRNRMVVSFNEPKAGREYKRTKPTKRVHRASAPGEAPAVDSGHLQNTIEPDFPTPLKGVLTIGAEYARWLEEGTDRIAPRPFIFPALKGALEQLP
jgi:hypothetical protein